MKSLLAEELADQHEVVKIGDPLRFCICGDCRLGRGSYGIVFKGKLKVYVEDKVAVKEIDVAVKRVDRLNIKIEEEILRRVNGHPNILLYYTTERKADYL